eukprot:15338676-Ditylum_brightwellii.AAC.1
MHADPLSSHRQRATHGRTGWPDPQAPRQQAYTRARPSPKGRPCNVLAWWQGYGHLILLRAAC